MFVNQKIGFMDISKIIINAYDKFDKMPHSIEDVFALDKEVRSFSRSSL